MIQRALERPANETTPGEAIRFGAACQKSPFSLHETGLQVLEPALRNNMLCRLPTNGATEMAVFVIVYGLQKLTDIRIRNWC